MSIARWWEQAAIDEAVAVLDGLDASDPEKAHDEADLLIISWLPADIADAYMRLQERCPGWATA